MKKGRRLALVLAVAMIISLVPAAAFAGSNGASVIIAASYPGAKKVEVNSSAKTIVITIASSASDTLDKSKLSVTTQATGYSQFTKNYSDSSAVLSVSKPVVLEVSYQDASDTSAIPTRYKTSYTVSAVKAAYQAPTFGGSLKMHLVKGTNQTIDYAAITKLYTQNDGAAVEKYEFSDLTTSYSLVVNGTEYTDLSTGVTIAASDLSKTVVKPLAAGSSTLSIQAYQKGVTTAVGEATMTIDVVGSTTIDTIKTASISQLSAIAVPASEIKTKFKAVSGEELSYVIFKSAQGGSIYSGYKSEASLGTAVAFSTQVKSADLANTTYVPNRSNYGDMAIKYDAYGTSGLKFSGTVTVPVTAVTTELSDISIEVDNSDVLKFASINFVEAFRQKTGKTLTYISFTLPTSDCGILVESYNTTTKFAGAALTGGTLYSSSQLSEITFIPASKSNGSFWLYYTATDGGNTKNGRVKITVNATTTDDISYSMSADEVKYLSLADIKSALKSATGETDFTNIKFTELPSATLGTMYYQPSGVTSKAVVTSSDSFASSGSGRLVSDLVFVPVTSGTATFKYTVYTASNSTKGYSGTLTYVISASEYDLAAISLAAEFNKSVALSSADFTSAVAKYNNRTLDYVTFSFPSGMSSKYGNLLLDYVSGTTGYTVATSGTKYYVSSKPALSSLTFVPATGYSGTFAIPFTAYDTTGAYYTGKLNITVKSAGTTLDEITYTVSSDSTVYFKSTDINAKFAELTNVNFDYVTFKQPISGTIMNHYLNTTSTEKVSEGSKYYRTSGSLVDMVYYQPVLNATGTVTVTYYAYNNNLSDTYTGTIKITVGKPFTNTYTDVSTSNYYYNSVKWAVEKDIYTGVTQTNFGAKNNCTRADVVYFLWKTAGCPEPKSTVNPFTDVSATSKYYKAVLWAVGEGVTYGTTSTTFSPNHTVTRGEAMTFFWRQQGQPTASATSKFTDVVTNKYYTTAIYWAVEKSITNGTTTTTFSPNKTCNIAEIITFLYNYYGK